MKSWLIAYNLLYRETSTVTSDIMQSKEFPTKKEIIDYLTKQNKGFNVVIFILSITEVPEGWE